MTRLLPGKGRLCPTISRISGFKNGSLTPASEQGKDCNIEFASVHVIDQVDQDLFSSTQVQIMNDKKHLFFQHLTHTLLTPCSLLMTAPMGNVLFKYILYPGLLH